MTHTTLGEVKQLLNSHITEHKEDKKSYMHQFEMLNKALEGKVSWQHYTWVLGILIMLLMAMFTYIASQIHELSTTTTVVQQDVSYLKGKLAPYDVKFNN